jgi:hypothetical protein
MELRTDGWVFSNELKLEAYFTDPAGFAEFVIPYEERTGHTHNVTVWKTGVEVLGFMMYERLNHFMRARVFSPHRTVDIGLNTPPRSTDDPASRR